MSRFGENLNEIPCEKCGRLIAGIGTGRVYCLKDDEKNRNKAFKVCQECRDKKYGKLSLQLENENQD